MGLDAITNFGYATLAAGITSSATSLTVTTGEGADLPSGQFTAVIWDTAYASPTLAKKAGAAELVLVGARSTDTLSSISRAQEGTTAKNFNTSGHTYAIAVVFTKAAYDKLAVKIVTGVAMAALAINTSEDLNTKTVSANSTFTFSATPTVGQVFRMRLTEGGGADRTIGIPSSYSQNRRTAITDFTLPANATVDLVWHYDGTTYFIFNDPMTLAQIGYGSGDVTAASSFSTDNRLIRSDGTGKGVQASYVQVDDDGTINVLGDSIPGSLGFADADATSPEVVTLTAPNDISASYAISLPAAIGTSGQVPTIDAVSGTVATLKWGTPSGSGTVTKVSVATANGFSGTVANDTSTPAITIVAGAITPTSVNGVTISGSSTPTLAVTGTTAVSGTNTGDNAVNSNYSGLVSNATHTGDATGSTALTLATVNSNVGSFTNASITVNAKGLVTAASSGSGGSGTKTYAVFTALDAIPTATNFATFDTRNSIPVLDFDGGSTNEETTFIGVMPEGASLGAGLKVRIHWMATSATSGNCRWGVCFEKTGADLDSDSYDTAVEAHTACSGTSGVEVVTELTVTTIDSITAGDRYRLKVYRDASDTTNDTIASDCELVSVEVRSAA